MLKKAKLSVILCGLFIFAAGAGFAKELPRLIIFHSPTCHKCLVVKNTIIPEIEKEFKGRIAIEYRDIDEEDNYIYFFSLEEKYKNKIELKVPSFFMEGEFLMDKGQLREGLRALIMRSLDKIHKEEELKSVNIKEFFKRFKLLGVIIAGLEDGFNPCAFTVIVFFISFLALQGYRRRELVAIGSCFILSVFVTYFLIGLGIFNFLYSLKGFWVVTRGLTLFIGILSIALGALAVYDFLKFKRTGSAEGMILQLPKAVKNQIHSVIGMHYRKTKEMRDAGQNAHIGRLILSALVTGFLICLLEAVCTGQLYLPTISFILKTTDLKFQAFSYLLIYNIMFIAPLLAIFVFALAGVSSAQFSKFMARHLALIKILMAVLFFGLGIFLIWRL